MIDVTDNAAQARKQIDGHRRQIRGSVQKWKDYKEDYEKQNQLKTIQNVQNQIQKLKSQHPSLKHDNDKADEWSPGNSI